MKTIKKLLLLSASMTLLSGCNLLSLGGNTQQNNQNQQNQVELAKIVVTNYTKTVQVGTAYHFNGTVLACYSDNSTKVVTDYNVGNVDTSKAGTVKFVVSYTENGKTVTATLTITVISSGQGGDSEDDDDDEKVSVTGVTLNKGAITLKVGGSETLIATVSPSNASNKSVSWSSSDDSVASVSTNGAVSARKEGTAVITVSTADGGFTETCAVTVEKDEQGREEVSAEEAYQIMNTLGSGVVSEKEYYVRGIAKNIEIDSYGSMKGSFEGTQVTFESVKAKGLAENASDVEGKEIVILGYLELYNGSYKIGYLPASVSPTGEKYNPSLIQIVDSGSGDDDTTVDVTGVTLSKTTAEICVGKTLALIATVSPSNATNKNVSWSSSNESVATVSNGVVTAKAVGNATITVTTEDGSHTATCAVTVKEETTPPVGEKSTVYTFKNDQTSAQNMGTWTSTQFMQHVVVDGSEIITGIKDVTNAYIGGNGGKSDTSWELWDCFKVGKSNASGSATLTLDNSKDFESIKIKAIGNRDDGTLTVNSITKNVTKKAVKGDLEPIELEYDISGGISELTLSSKEATSGNYGIVITEIEFVGTDEGGSGSGGGGETETVSVTGVSLNKTTAEIKVGETLSLSATVSPSNASNKSVSWSSDNESVATVSNGTVTAKSKGTATITVTTADGGKTATCSVTVNEKQTSNKSAWTIMLYICGSNLEYSPGEQAGYASQDIEEILSAAIPQNPSDPAQKINIIMQTGGIGNKGKWYLDAKTYIEGGTAISSSAEQRWEVKGSKLALKSTLSTNAISTQSHLANFIDWGLTNYEAERTALILWDHGAGIGGCLNDEASGNYLKNSDITAATRTALSKHGDVDKMDFIAYDCCLMGCADIASVNADYYNYMVGSQESEFAGGYDYDEWLKVIKANPTGCTTLSVCDSIAQTFVQEQCYDYRDCEDCHQTNAVYDLSKMSQLVTDFNTFATSLSINSQTKFNTMCKEFEKCLAFGADSDGSLFGLCDFVDLINKLSAKYSVSGTAVINDIKNVVVKNYYCTEYGSVKPCGMNAFVAHAFNNPEYPIQISYDDYKGSDSTKFSVWQTMNQDYGEYYDY